MHSILLVCYCTLSLLSGVLAITLKDKSDPIQVVLYGRTEITCTFKSASPVIFSWKFNGLNIVFSNDVYQAPITSQMKSLIIKNVTLSKQGTYTCVGSNNEGTAQGTVQVSVLETTPEISPFEDVYLKLDESLMITCYASNAIPKASFTWGKQGAGIIDGVNIIDRGNGSLYIKSMKENYQGTYQCNARNAKGSDSKLVKVILANVTKWLSKPVGNTDVKSGEFFEFIATVISPMPVSKITWMKDGNLIKDSLHHLKSTGSRYTTTLVFSNLNTADTGLYQLNIDVGGISGLSAEMKLTVWAKPDTQIGEGSEMTVVEGETVKFVCNVHGYPAPDVRWQRNNSIIKGGIQNLTRDGFQTRRTIEIQKVAKNDQGIFTCFAWNNQGNSSASIKLTVEDGGEDESGTDKTVLIVVVVFSIIAVIAIVILIVIYCKFKDTWCGKYNSASGTFYTDLVQEEKEASTLDDIENNPYAIKKNINISIKYSDRTASIGEKNKQASMKGMSLKGRSLKMSVKSPTSTVAENQYAPLDSIVGQGKNIDFKRIFFDEILGTGEYGLVNGGRVIDDEDPTIYKDVSIKMLKDDATAQERRDILAEVRMMRRIAKHSNVIEFVGWCITDDNVYVVEEYAPFGCLLSFLRMQRSMKQDCGSEQLPEEDQVDQNTLLSFAHQISSGMMHLAALNIVHRDLACRNVYLGHEKTCKISEYGLARDIYSENVFRKTTGGQLPVRWMAYEAVFNGQYSTEADVWSFGILLWELVNLGKIPYPGIVRTEQLLDELESGYHMENPGHISTDLYLMMNSCWNRQPESRLTFEKLNSQLGKMQREEEEEHIDLQKLLELEMEEANEDITSPTADFHRPPVFTNAIPEEEQEESEKVAPDDIVVA